MRGGRAERFVLLLTFILLLVVGVLTAQEQRRQQLDRLSGSSYSSGASGARALYLWLGEMGYPVERLEGPTYTLPQGAGSLWLLDASEIPITEVEANSLRAWVEGGGHLLWANQWPNTTLLDAFEVEYRWLGQRQRPVTPWIRHPRAAYRSYFAFEAPPGATHLLANQDGALGAFYQPLGEGGIWFFSTLEPFTNQALHDPSNSALIEGLLGHLPPATPITFDEFHHGFGHEANIEQPRLLTVMRESPWGWGVFYGAALLALWLLLRGRRFGRPLPLPGEHLRREAGEYAQSMAWLYRRARLRAPILQHHHARLKRQAAERYRLTPLEDDAAFVQALVRYQPELDTTALLQHLRALRRSHVSEAELLALARANDEWMEVLGRRPSLA